MNSETPRTDAQRGKERRQIETVDSDFARTLERELAAMTAERDEKDRQLSLALKGKRPFSNAHAEEVIAWQVKRITELEEKLNGWFVERDTIRAELNLVKKDRDNWKNYVGQITVSASFIHDESKELGLRAGQCILVAGIPALKAQRDALRAELDAVKKERDTLPFFYEDIIRARRAEITKVESERDALREEKQKWADYAARVTDEQNALRARVKELREAMSNWRVSATKWDAR